jgi:hypothetical protein
MAATQNPHEVFGHHLQALDDEQPTNKSSTP